MSKTPHIVIAGAGLLGRLLSWQLSQHKVRITLIDQDHPDGHACAARIAAAMLAPFSELVSSDLSVFEKGLQSLKIWPQWLEQLAKATNKPIDFQHRGSLVVAHPQDQNLLTQFSQQLAYKLASERNNSQWLNQQQLESLEPELNAFQQGIYLPDEGCIDNWGLLDALASILKQPNIQWLQRTVINVASHSVETSKERITCDLAIDCRGFGGKPQWPELRGVRGEILWVEAPEVHLTRPVRLMHPRYQLYIAPKPEHRYVIGATQIESESSAPITVRSSMELQSALYSVQPAFAEANILHGFAGCRPAFMDNLPKIHTEPGLLRVNGLYRHGYLLGPSLVQQSLQKIATMGLIDKQDVQTTA